MSRELSATNATRTTARTVNVIVFCELDFVGEPILAHSNLGPITWGGKTWLGVGDFGGFSDIEEGADISARGITLTLSGIPSNLLGHALASNYRGRKARLWFGMLNAAGTLDEDPYQIFGGRIDTMTIADEGETSTISVACENRLIDLRRPRVSRYTHEEQIARYAGDLGLSFVARLAEKPLYWGIPNSNTASTQSTPRIFAVWHR